MSAPPSDKPTVAAFFDLDNTLIDANSAWLWTLHERKLGNVTLLQQARVALWLGLYRLSVVDMETALDAAIRHYRGTHEETLDRRTREWFHEEVVGRLRPGAADALDEHRAQRHQLVLLTTASSFEAAEATRVWKLDGWLANAFPTDEAGRLTGQVSRPVCYGPGKVAHAEQWASEHDLALEDCYFYTDSYSDLPMLERVGSPRVVNPDLRLQRAARRRGWPVLDW